MKISVIHLHLGFIFLMFVYSVSSSLQNVIVIGGGVAGIAAARKLSNDKLNRFVVQIYEAKRERYGGRVWTKRNLSSSLKDIQADLGADFINSQAKNNLFLQLIRKYEIDSGTLDPSQFFDSRTGKIVQGPDLNEANTAAKELVLRAIEKAKKIGRDISVRDIVDQEIESQGLHQDSLIVNQIKQLPSYNYPDFSALLYSPNQVDFGYDTFVKYGLAEVIDRLVGGVESEAPLDINLRHIVRQIQVVPEENRAIVRVLGGSQISVDAVIIAVPLSVIKNNSILFDPPLTKDFYKAFNAINVINFEKLIIEFDELFWPKDIGTFQISSEHDKENGMMLTWMNLFKISNKPYLATVISHNAVEEYLKMSDEKVLQVALARLSKLFGESVIQNRNVTNILRSDWLKSLHIGGASVYPSVGNTAELWDVFSEHLCPGIYFAGDYTILEELGSLHGAYNSGVRAAEALMSGICEKKAKEDEKRRQKEEKSVKNDSKSDKDEL